VHWRTTARTGSLVVTDSESQRRAATWLLVDLGGGEEAETAAGMGAYLAEKLWQSGAEVGAVVAGTELVMIPATRARDQLNQLLEPLAVVPAAALSQAERLLRAAHRCASPGQFVLISAAVDDQHYIRALHRLCPALVRLDPRGVSAVTSSLGA
jgi:uncharacterized protein (DUF58 family)